MILRYTWDVCKGIQYFFTSRLVVFRVMVNFVELSFVFNKALCEISRQHHRKTFIKILFLGFSTRLFFSVKFTYTVGEF